MCRVMSDSAECPSGPGAALRRLRELAEVSASELARLAGVAQNTILNAERGTSMPRPDARRRISAALATLLDADEARRRVRLLREQHDPDRYAVVVRNAAQLRAAESWLTHIEAAEDPFSIWSEEAVA